MIQRTRGEKIFNVFNYLILILIGFTTVYPLLYTFSISVSTKLAAESGGLHILPTWGQITLDPYIMVFKNQEIWRAYGYTIFRTVVGTVLGVIVCCFYGYTLSRPTLCGKSSLQCTLHLQCFSQAVRFLHT